ncbi:tyrosine-protein kinase family protein [Thioclava kandeliae]|uniref:CpsD/CapB family tyrosine-protein kinase n=1 Tax=Thioclava kandeliae TaxID=3070818 RepID=A0ABV1SLQ6_9RHOB
MEKLQKALEKARAERLARQGMPTGSQRDSASVERAITDQASAWAQLPECKLSAQELKKNRVLTFNANSEATYYDILRTRLRDECRRQNYKRIAITSPQPQAGKSTTLANLAFSLGRLPYQRTIIFDFDLRRPSLHKILGLTPKADMGQLLRGEVPVDEHLVRHGENLAFGLNKSMVQHSAELLQSERTQDFLTAVEETFQPDLMLFDMPPFLAADDAHGFLKNIDAVLLIAESEKTTKVQLDAVEQKISSLTKIAGIVLNKCNYVDENDTGSYDYY